MIPTATTPYQAGPIRTVEEICCPACQSRLSQTDYERTYPENKDLHTLQMVMKTDCTHCGSMKTAVFHLKGGTYELQSITDTHQRPRAAASTPAASRRRRRLVA